MDGDRVASGMILVLIFTLLPAASGEATPTCPSGDYLSTEGVCCNKCLPGFKLQSECKAAGQRSDCVECPSGQFTENPNFSRTCWACRPCKSSRNEFKESNCTASKDTVCHCKDGYYKYSIGSIDYQCVRCKSCKQNEEQIHGCSSDRNTMCQCKPGFYRVKGKCEHCDGCRAECGHLCPKAATATTVPPTKMGSLINGICLAVVAAVSVAMSVLVTHFLTKRCSRKKSSSTQSPDDPLDSAETQMLPTTVVDPLPTVELQVLKMEEAEPPRSVEAAPLRSEPEKPMSNLPDCIPLEVKTHEVIYMVLDRVPVPMVKRLVRLLGVREIDIEQAEVDWRYCRDAHFQMLKTWAQTSLVDGTRHQILSRQMLQDLIRTLREIHLVAVAEALEAKYSGQ
ncbi:tumor necrosis factor receptor superfamily member 1A isoform X1 [Synchiropus splendidus]|uniref:tumor necrosis factor receptor superfamily member 1A isoform X1 n=1 Tax=Synchiropus splendidus TaxID=270530 RepID=UPI00237D5C47|nr:tumor necrosis factor receptor superfamily member 1A isoform X1 [Synchiropus splendidus]XP_053700152.1 tumor necrosis factor receptor superfamily member 1A isoform X1 [Synchiropus splendidus]